MAQGLTELLEPQDFSVIVNTADDFIHYGLNISPDLDTICYTLAKIVDSGKGWGIRNDTNVILNKLKFFGGPTWFALGDVDIATHMERTRRLSSGETLTEVTTHLARRWGIQHKVLPMSDDHVYTQLETEELGVLSFQEYFVKHHFKPRVKKIFYSGIEQAQPSQSVLSALNDCDAVIICPSNPLLSIDPIIKMKGIVEILQKKFVVSVSPLIQNKSLKGPLSKILEEMGHSSGLQFIYDHYKKFLNCIIIDNKDAESFFYDSASGIIALTKDIYLPDLNNRVRLAQEILQFLNNKV